MSIAIQVLESQLQALEVELHHPGVRCDRSRLEELLHPDFHEVGRSGRAYDRLTVIDFLLRQPSPPRVRSEAFRAVEIAPDASLLTYRSMHVTANGESTLHTHRSSLWLRVGGRWQLRYHQGTPAAETW